MEERDPLAVDTLSVHAGQEPDPETGAVAPPLHLASTFAQDAVGETRAGFDYSRGDNPTRQRLELALAKLESPEAQGVAFASGMAAVETIMHFLPPKAKVVCVEDVYGGVFRLFSRVWEPRGYSFEFLPAAEINDDLAAHLEGTHLLWLETPTNPLLSIVDVAKAAAVAKEHGAAGPMGPLVVVDNTFASPYLQRPLELGAHLSLHSTTKYLGGHSDLVGGFVATKDPVLAERLRFLQMSQGAVPSPFDCWLLLRSLRTLHLRMQRHSANARLVAAFLVAHPRVRRVLYPGLETHPGHDVAGRQMRDFGGMVSFLLESEAEAVSVCERTRLFTLAESLGGVESLIEHPLRMTHASSAKSQAPAPPELVRLSVGVEDPDDLVADLEQALA